MMEYYYSGTESWWCGNWNHLACRRWKCEVDHPSQSTEVNLGKKQKWCSLWYPWSQVQQDTSGPDNFRILGWQFFLLWNHLTEFNETWKDERSQHPPPSLCFSGWLEKQDNSRGQSIKKCHIVLICAICGFMDPLPIVCCNKVVHVKSDKTFFIHEMNNSLLVNDIPYTFSASKNFVIAARPISE